MENKKNDKDSVGPLGSAIMEIPKGGSHYDRKRTNDLSENHPAFVAV